MFQVGFNVPEGYEYDKDDINSSMTYEKRYEEVYEAFINDKVICAKVVKVSEDNKTLYLDFGSGVKGICDKNYIADSNSYWINKYLEGKYVNVKIYSFNVTEKAFMCMRDILQIKAIEQQKEEYIVGTKVKGKILGYNRKIVVVDIGAGNLIVVPITLFKHCWLTPEKEYVNFVIGTFDNRYNNFKVSVDDGREKLLYKVKVISKIEEGYLVSYINEPSKHDVMKTKKELELGDVVMANLQKLKFTNKVLTYFSECKD